MKNLKIQALTINEGTWFSGMRDFIARGDITKQF